jgi:hypothetical protein
VGHHRKQPLTRKHSAKGAALADFRGDLQVT